MRTTFCLIMVALIGASSAAQGASVLLDSWSAGDSTYYEYFSDGFYRMDLYSPPPNNNNQSFHAISNPSTIYNQTFDGFPNNEFMRFGSAEYDESGLVGGTGTAPITGLNLGIANDPANPAYQNFRRFATNTIVDPNSNSLVGTEDTVELLDGKVVGMNLNVDIVLEIPSFLSATIPGYYPGTFKLTGTTFEIDVEGTQNLDTVFGTADVHLKWDFQGRTFVTADFDDDGDADGFDFLAWQRGYGITTGATLGDGDASGEGAVDDKDLKVWDLQYGAAGVPLIGVAAVPEPSTAILLLPAMAAVLGPLNRLRHSQRRKG